MDGFLVVFAFVGLFVLGFPVVLAIGIPCIVYIFAKGLPIDLVAQRTLYALDSFPLVAVPVFLFVGSLMNSAGISRYIYRFADTAAGRLPGGLAQVNIFGSLIFAGMSGSALADIGGLGRIEIDAMKSKGLTVTSDPARSTATGDAPALAYLITASEDRFGVYTFSQQFEAVQVNEVASSVLGVVGRVTLALGFLAVLTSLLISIDERRREFGILAAVGITDDVLYLFLVESGLLIAMGLVVGVIFGGGMFALLLPSIFSLGTVGKAVALVSVYFPIMLILGALIPAWRLLQKSPLELLRSSP